MTPMEKILQTWESAILAAYPAVTRVYYSPVDRRTGTDEDDYVQTGSDAPQLPYIELLSFDDIRTPNGLSGLEMETPTIVVSGSWPRSTGNQDRTIEVQSIGRISAGIRAVINARMLAHNMGSNPIAGVGMTTLVVWTTANRPSLDNQSDVDEFRLTPAFTHFPIPGT